MAQLVKNLPTMLETWVQSRSLEDPLEKGMATHFSILAWRIPLTEEPFGLQCSRLQRVRHNWAPKHSQHSTFLYIPEVYHVMSWCTHTLWNDYQGQDNEYIHLVTQLTFFLNWELKIYCQQTASIQYSITNYSQHAVLYSLRTYSSYNWRFISFDLHLSISCSLQFLLTTILFSLSMKLNSKKSKKSN